MSDNSSTSKRAGYNRINLIGRLGGDAENRVTPTGKNVTSFSVAVDQRDGNTLWFRCSLWGERGQKLSQYLLKGKKVLVSGPLSFRIYEKTEGGTGFSLEVNVDDLELLSPRAEGEGETQPAAAGEEIPF